VSLLKIVKEIMFMKKFNEKEPGSKIVRPLIESQSMSTRNRQAEPELAAWRRGLTLCLGMSRQYERDAHIKA
jgi:hypothetical protein